MNRARFVVAALGVAACTAAYRPPAGNTVYGSYPFKQVLSNANPPMTLEGTVVLLPDTVVLTVGGKSCSASVDARNSNDAFAYNCGESSFYLNKQDPLRFNSYRVPTIVWQTRQVCVMYAVNRMTGAEQCSRYGQERVETRIVLSGPLKFVER